MQTILTSLLNADEDLFKQEQEEFSRYMSRQMLYPKFYACYARLQYYWYKLIEKTICKRYGHNIDCDASWATPDSGGESFYCKRCGDGWTNYYY